MIFRKAALDKLASPDQLDLLMQVTKPRSWLAFLGLAAILIMAIIWSLTGSLALTVNSPAVLINSGGIKNIVALQQGQVSELLVAPGAEVKEGQAIATTTGPDAEAQTVYSPYSGKILELKADVGMLVTPGTPLASLEFVGENVKEEAILYLSAADARRVQPNMLVKINPAHVAVDEHGYVLGRVLTVSEFPATRQGILRTLGSEELMQLLVPGETPREVRVELLEDSSTVSGVRWSTGTGPDYQLGSGTIATASIVVAQQRPIELVIPLR